MRTTLTYFAAFLIAVAFVILGFFNMPFLAMGLLILALILVISCLFMWESEMLDSGQYLR